jgi:N-acetylneuraminate lyase
MENLHGVYSATFTPYGKNGRFNAEMFEKVVAFHARNGLKGLYVGGSSGEGALQKTSERIEIAGCAIELCRKYNLKSIIHVGHCSTDIALEIARAAEAGGADAISSVQPYYYSFTQEQCERYYMSFIEKINLPMIIYMYLKNFTPDSMQSMLKLLRQDKIIGIKYTANDFFTANSLFKQLPDNKLFFSGADEHMIVGLTYNSCGSIGLYQNSVPGAFKKLYDAFRSGDFEQARQYQMRINTLIECVSGFGDYSYVKAIMRYIGFDCGYFRAPLKQLSEGDYCQLALKLEQFDDLFALNN